MISGSVYLYADDTTVYCIKRTADEAVAQLKLYNWCLLNRLTPHPEKSEAMLISKTRAVGPMISIRMGTDIIEWVNKFRLSGMTVDDTVTWIPHMLDLQKSFAKKLDLIRRAPNENIVQNHLNIALLNVF